MSFELTEEMVAILRRDDADDSLLMAALDTENPRLVEAVYALYARPMNPREMIKMIDEGRTTELHKLLERQLDAEEFLTNTF